MNSKSNLLKNLKDLLPYFLLIAIYFFFVNLEARKEKDNVQYTENKNSISIDKSGKNEKNLKIKIPVIPYNQ